MYSEYKYIYIYIYTVYTTDIYSTGLRMSNFGIVIHCIGLGCHVYNRNFVFDLCSVFHECNPGIKCDLPV